MLTDKIESLKTERLTVSSSESFLKNGPYFAVSEQDYVQTDIHYKGVRGEKFSSSLALIWIKEGKEFLREPYWFIFDDKKRTINILTKVPKAAEECLLGLRVNCETPRRGDAELLVDDIQHVKIQRKKKIPNNPRYIISKMKKDLFPDDLIRDSVTSRRKLFNHILVKIQSLYLKNSLVFGYPLMAFIDPSNLCNYKCPLCPTGRSDQLRKRGLLKLHDFQRIMDQVGKHLYKLNLYNWGEPFLNKDLIAMIRYAKKFDLVVESNTNLSILDDKLAKELVASDLDYLIVAVDGMTNDSYEKYRVGGNLEKVLDNLRLLLKTKKRFQSTKPNIIISFLPNRYNEEDLPQAIEFFRKLETSFTVGKLRLDMCDEITKTKKDIAPFVEWLPLNPELSVYDENLNKSLSETCLWPWELICIHPEGNVSPCCAVYSQKYDFSNVFHKHFLRIWNGKRYREARKIIRKRRANADSSMPCNYCITRGGYLDYQPSIHYSVF